MTWRILPLFLLFVIAIALTMSLLSHNNASERISKMIGQTPAAFNLASLSSNEEKPLAEMLNGQVTVVNLFASWCVSCAVEHPVLLKLKEKNTIPIIGIGWRDKPEKLQSWLKDRGNPYSTVLVDAKGASTVALGLSGVPETFIFDKHGVIAYNAKMPLTEVEVTNVILPLIERLQRD